MNGCLSRAASRTPGIPAVLGLAVSLVLLQGCATDLQRAGAPTANITNAVLQVARAPLDPQQVQDQETMTWLDYHPIPGRDWADPRLVPERKFRMAIVAVDFPDQPFVITQKRKSDLFGNPQIDPIPRAKVPQFYADFFNRPSAVNHGHTINGYWMEQSRGKFGIGKLDAFGPYQLPKKLWEYGLNEWGQREATPTGAPATGRLERDTDALWRQDAGNVRTNYDAVLRLYAGYDETGVWQEFGEMKFQTRDDIPPEWGNPDPTKPRWVITRYVPWTSWRAGAMQWGLSTIRQGENSGTITHELGHFAFGIGDNNNNPYVQPYRRVGSGPWDMMDRGSFNGPGGPHRRWVVPPTEGAAMPAGLMLRNKLKNKFLGDGDILRLSRDGLAKSGLVIAQVTAREIEPLSNSFAGIVVALDGENPHDRTPVDDPATNPLSSGRPNFDNYTLEVVQRIGYDSFCPDSGVLIARNKDRESSNGGTNGFNCFTWVIDAHPEDMNKIDYRRPHGEAVMRTIADSRQLNDALFHAGLNSGSEFEWEDKPNRLHFYVIDLHRDSRGIRNYTLGVRSLDASGLQAHGIALAPPAAVMKNGGEEFCEFQLRNPEAARTLEPGLHPQDVSAFVQHDLYRLAVTVSGTGWTAHIPNALVAVKYGDSIAVPVYLRREAGGKGPVTLTLRAQSESDSRLQAIATFALPGSALAKN